MHELYSDEVQASKSKECITSTPSSSKNVRLAKYLMNNKILTWIASRCDIEWLHEPSKYSLLVNNKQQDYHKWCSKLVLDG